MNTRGVAMHEGKYIVRVSTGGQGGITMGFTLDASAFDDLKIEHRFEFTRGRFIHMSATEFYRVEKLITKYIKEMDHE